MARRDPLRNPEPLIRRVYSYVAYRLGSGPEAEDVTSEVFERALRYRSSYDPARGEPTAWLLGIARRCVDDAVARRPPVVEGRQPEREPVPHGVDESDDLVNRLAVRAAMAQLDERGRDLIALRYGADLTARQIASMLGMKPNTVEVALHRTLVRLRSSLEGNLA